MKKAKESFQKAAKSIGNGPKHNQGGVIHTGMKVNLMHTYSDDENQGKEVVDNHIFK